MAVSIKTLKIVHNKKIKHKDFPGSTEVKNPPCSARDMDSIPGQETKVPHATKQLSLPVATTDPMSHN